MNRQTRDLVRAVKAAIAHNAKAMAPALDARPEPQFRHPEYRYVQVAQNTLRTCLEATLQQGMPYSEMTCIELAVRLASYAVSALPLESQDAALKMVIDTLPSAHSQRLAAGIIISTEWEANGLTQPNVPGGRA